MKTYTREEVAELFGVHPSNISRWVAKGDLASEKVNNRHVFTQVTIDKFLKTDFSRTVKDFDGSSPLARHLRTCLACHKPAFTPYGQRRCAKCLREGKDYIRRTKENER